MKENEGKCTCSAELQIDLLQKHGPGVLIYFACMSKGFGDFSPELSVLEFISRCPGKFRSEELWMAKIDGLRAFEIRNAIIDLKACGLVTNATFPSLDWRKVTRAAEYFVERNPNWFDSSQAYQVVPSPEEIGGA